MIDGDDFGQRCFDELDDMCDGLVQTIVANERDGSVALECMGIDDRRAIPAGDPIDRNHIVLAIE